MAIKLLLCWFALLCLTQVASAQQNVVVRTSIEPAQAVLGQEVRLYVDVLFSDEMAHPPRVRAPQVAGAQVFRFESQATNLSDTIAGREYVGQRFEFDIYPRRAGVLQIPTIQVTLLDRSGGEVGALTGSAQTVTATVPPGLDASQPIVAANRVTLRETWQPQAGPFHVGDALVRTVTRSAAGVPGLALVDLPFPTPDGVRSYVDPPSISDRVERGEVTGERTDKVTYVLEKAGSYTLPGIVQPWWNLAENRAESLSRPAFHIEVQAAAAEESSVGRSERSVPVWLGIAGAVLVAAVLLLVGLRCHFASWLAALRATPTVAERAAFRTLRAACRRDDAAEIYRSWRHWIGFHPAEAAVAIQDPTGAMAKLERHLFGGGEWGAADAIRIVRQARAARARSSRRRERSSAASLPLLNPGQTTARSET